MKITIDTSKITSEDLGLFLSRYEVQEPIPEDPEPPVIDPPIKNIKDLVDAYYNSDNAIGDDKGVVMLKGIKGPDLPYVGVAKPTVGMPHLNNGEVVFMNQPNANYKTLTRGNNNPFALPEELTIVFRKMPGTDWEAILSGWGLPYIAFGSDNIRAGNADSYLKVKAFPKSFELCFIHALYEKDGVTLWLKGNNLGKIATTNIHRRLGYGVGIETNSTDFNWKASMFIERSMSDREREDYFEAIKSEYKIGSMPELPYASDIKIVNKGGKLTASYKYNGQFPEDKSKVEYQWWQLSPDLGNQKMISAASSINNMKGVKVCVKVCDVKGNSWMFISGTYN